MNRTAHRANARLTEPDAPDLSDEEFHQIAKIALQEAGLAIPDQDATGEELQSYDEARKKVLKTNAARIKRAEMLSMVLNTLGGGLGLVLFGWFSNRMGRRGAFVFYHLIAFGLVILLFNFLLPRNASTTVLAICLPTPWF